jgi:hypothetical protein
MTGRLLIAETFPDDQTWVHNHGIGPSGIETVAACPESITGQMLMVV